MLLQTLCLGGGAIGGYAHLGFLQAVSDHQPLRIVETWVGCSIGAIVALLSCVGYTPEQLFEKCRGVNEEMFNFSATTNLSKTFGMDDAEYIRAFMIDLLIEAGMPPTLTFGLLREQTVKRLIVCVTNVNAARAIYYTPETHPDASVIDAIRASISVPILLTPVHDGPPEAISLLVDGGLKDNFPIRFALDDFARRYEGRNPQLSVGGCNIVSLPQDCIKDFVTYLLSLLVCVMGRQDVAHDDCSANVPLSHGDSFNFSASDGLRRRLFDAGLTAGKKFIETSNARTLPYLGRRRSM